MTETVVDLVNTFEDDSSTAIVHNGNPVSYQGLYNDITRLAASLSIEDDSDNHFVIITDDKYELLVGIYSAIYAGGVAVPVDTALAENSIERIVDVTEPSLILTSSSETAASLGEETELIEDQLGGSHLMERKSIEDSRTAMILFTSGTTGDKKGVLLSHRNLMDTSQYINDFMGVGEDITEHVLVPLYHSFGFARTRCVFMAKGTLVLDDGQFNPLLAFKRMDRFDCDAFSGVPAVMAMLLKAGESRASKIADQIKYVEIGSAPMPREHKERLVSTYENANICMHYGLTEASRTCFIDFAKESEKLDSVGKPSPGVSVKIIDENGEEQPEGQTGEIVVSGPNVAKGYLERSVQDQSAAIGEWFRTGDMGYKDEDGYVHFLGREDNLINVGGESISPLEIEKLISESSAAPEDFCVVGDADFTEIYDEVPVLCTTSTEFTDDDLDDLNQSLNSLGLREVFHPRRVCHLKSIPRTDNGKILRHEIDV